MKVVSIALAVVVLCSSSWLRAAPVRPDLEPDTEVPSDDLVCEAGTDVGADGIDPNQWTGRFGGVGIEIQLGGDALTVSRPLKGGPADKAGIQAGDQINKINDEFTYGLGLSECVSKMRGEPGTTVILTIYRPATGETRQCRITRAFVRISTVKDAQMLAGKVGYLRIASFNRFTGAEVRETIEQLEKTGARAWVIDLRGNKGGLLRSARDVGSRFLDPGQVVFMLQEPRLMKRQEFQSSRQSAHTSGPLAVLINSGTAGAAEVVAGACRLQRRAALVGGPSFGHGRVIQLQPKPDGTAVAADGGECLLPNGASLIGRSLKPDLDMTNEPNQEPPILQRNPGNLSQPRSLAEDRVVQRAVDHCLGQLGLPTESANP